MPVLLDLFCGVGGASMGYRRAGFEIIGVDIRPQPRYPFRFYRADAVTFPLDAFDVAAVHASPPCQAYIPEGFRSLPDGRVWRGRPLLIDVIRDRLIASGLPYVIENVEPARRHLREPVTLCGSMFGLPVRRHRLFECSVQLDVPRCAHELQTERRYPTQRHDLAASPVVQVYGHGRRTDLWPAALGVPWTRNRDELAQAIPPAYTEHIGRQLIGAAVPS
jgi:DNA (cytosine-5)-methyltransferase 1